MTYGDGPGRMRSKETETKGDDELGSAVELTGAVPPSGFTSGCMAGGRSISGVANGGPGRLGR